MADDVIVGMRFEDIGGMESLDPVNHHSTTDTPHDADRQASLVIFPGSDEIQAIRHEELRPKIDLPIVHCMAVGGNQVRCFAVSFAARLRDRLFDYAGHGLLLYNPMMPR